MSASRKSITGGQLVVAEFIRHDVERVYCVPGESYLAVIDAFFDAQEKITQVTCRHESGAGMMALAEAELSNRPAVCFVTRGPGATNVSIAVHIADQASVPLVLCVGQVSSSRLGRESFQEMDYQQFFGSTSKSVFNVCAAEEIPGTLGKAFALAKSGRPGPVVVVFPEDILREVTTVAPRPGEFGVDEPKKQSPDLLEQGKSTQALLEKIRQALSKAVRPLIIAGGSLWSDEVANQLQHFAELNGIPVLTSFRRNDVMNNHSSSYAGYLGLNQHAGALEMVERADCVLVIGARLDEPTTGDYSLPIICDAETPTDFANATAGAKGADKWIHVYPDFEAIAVPPNADIKLEMNTRAFLDIVADQSLMGEGLDKSWVTVGRRDYEASLDHDFASKYDTELLNLPLLMRELVPMLPDDAVITTDAGNFTFWPQRFCRFARPGRLLAPVNGAMGYGVPAGIAASLVYPERVVVTFVGDGGMMMTGMEMATAIRNGAKPIIIVFNNSLYGTIDSHQRRDYPGRQHGNNLSNPDFVKFAESFGAAAVRVKTVHDFANAFLQAKQLNELTLIELVLHEGDDDRLSDT